MNCINLLLQKLDLLNIDGFEYKKTLGGGSALSSLYTRDDEKVVFKFLISPRNLIELERFKLECSVLEKNRANSVRRNDGFILKENVFMGPITSYPLPIVKYSLTQKFSGLVSFFGYSYEEGVLLSDMNAELYSYDEKLLLLYRLASGLSYFNQTGYSHRDLHPENILLLDNFSMLGSDRNSLDNDPRIKFLDMGNCQRIDIDSDWLHRVDRDLDEDMVFADNNRRVLSSFVSMPPDFLEQGGETKNYDTWSFGIYAYKLLFGNLPFLVNEIIDVTLLRSNMKFEEDYQGNLLSVDLGLGLILKHLLSSKGSERPSIHTIVRLFSWMVYRNEDFQDRNFIVRVIHN